MARPKAAADGRRALFERLARARAACQVPEDRPRAILDLVELAFEEERQIAYTALEILAELGDDDGKEALQRIWKWGPTRDLRDRAQALLQTPSLQGDSTARPTNSPDLELEGFRTTMTSLTTSDTVRTEPRHHRFGRLLRYEPARPWRFPLLLLALVTAAETLITFVEPRVGLALHGAILFLILYNVYVQPGRVPHMSLILPTSTDAVRRFLLVMLLAPLVRLFTMGFPLAAWPRESWYAMVSVPLFITMFLIVRSERWSRDELGMRLGNLPLQLVVAISGLGLGWIEYQILAPAPLVAELTWQAVWLPALVLLVSTGLLEELLFRGLMQSAAIPLLGQWPAMLFVSAIFAALHIGYASAVDLLFVFAAGLFFSVIVLRTHSLLGVTLAHSLTNISLFLLWPHWLN